MTQDLKHRQNYHSDPRKSNDGDRRVKGRFSAIKNSIDFSDKSVLDLGCSGGYFSFNLAYEADYVLGVDRDKQVIEQNKSLKKEMEIENLTFICKKITPSLIRDLPNFDVILFLSVFHHMLASSSAYGWNDDLTYNVAMEVMDCIRKNSSVLVFEMGYPSEGYEWSSKIEYIDDPVTWIRENVFGDQFSRVRVINSPSCRGLIGKARKLAMDNMMNMGIISKVFSRLLSLDIRDNRHIFIGVK